MNGGEPAVTHGIRHRNGDQEGVRWNRNALVGLLNDIARLDGTHYSAAAWAELMQVFAEAWQLVAMFAT
jgi:hypothetical protein